MKILLTAVNAKYIHSNLAVYSLAAYALERFACDGARPEIEIAEYTINQPVGRIITDIYMKKPDLIMFSCYIWNRREIEEIVTDLGKVMPDVDIWAGGPEVSFDAADVLGRVPSLKGVICGEGEEIFFELAKIYRDAALRSERPDDRQLQATAGIVFRDRSGEMITTMTHMPIDLSCAPFPYDSLNDFENRIIYYESSRGCPFRCSYCLSSVEKSLRFRDLKLVEKELSFFLERNVPQVKFIDRTFNCDRERALKIWRFLRDNDNGITNFHFEIAGDIMDEAQLELLSELRPGQVQLEIGVQSTNAKTLEEINRPMDFEKLSGVVDRIKSPGNVHLHLDLIAGLPFEDYESFRASFDDVFALRPEQLQLGFLKVLKGSPIAGKCEEYGLKLTEAPPYEVLETKWISFDELIKLKGVEEMTEVYYNSGQFENTVEMLLKHFDSSFEFFAELASWYGRSGMEMFSFSRNQRYENLLRFGMEIVSAGDVETLRNAMIMDYYLRENVKTRPGFLGEDMVEKRFSKEFYSRESREHRYLSGGRYDTDDPRLLRKLTHIEKMGDDYYLFDYTRRDPMNNNALMIKLHPED